jgi:hypothetical protein
MTGPTGATGPIGPQGYSGWPYLDGGDPFSDFSLQPQNPGVQSVNAIVGNILIQGDSGVAVETSGQIITIKSGNTAIEKRDVQTNFTLSANDARYQFLNTTNGATEIYLPATADIGTIFTIKNTATVPSWYGWYLNVYTSTNVLLSSINVSNAVSFIYDGTTWFNI